MEILSKKISAKIKQELDLDSDKEEVIAYGLFAIIQIITSILSTLLFGFIFHVFFESLIVMITVITLRKYSGGVHAKSPKLCLIFGTIVSVSLGILSRSMFLIDLDFKYLILILACAFIFSFYIVYKKAPVGSKNKKIRDEKKLNAMKNGALKILSIYLLIVIVCMGFQTILNRRLSYIIFSIILGRLWQVFTLTKPCAFIIKKIESII